MMGCQSEACEELERCCDLLEVTPDLESNRWCVPPEWGDDEFDCEYKRSLLESEAIRVGERRRIPPSCLPPDDPRNQL